MLEMDLDLEQKPAGIFQKRLDTVHRNGYNALYFFFISKLD